jgi:ATP-binding cassette subfamily F protein uup
MREQPVRQAKAALQMGSTARRLGKRAIEAENLAIQVGDRLLLEEFSHDFGPEDRIGIIGPNGVGKSSLLDAIAGRLAPTSGRLELGSTVRLAYFDQHSAALQPLDAGRGVERMEWSSVLPSCWNAFCSLLPSSTSLWPGSPAGSGAGCICVGC